MEEQIKYIDTKSFEVIANIARLQVKRDTEGLEVWEEVSLEEYRKESDMLISIYASLVGLKNVMESKSEAA